MRIATTTRVTAAAVGAATLLAAGALPAVAQDPAERPSDQTVTAEEAERDPAAQLDRIKRRATHAIEVRLSVLERAQRHVHEARHLTDDHAAELTGIIRTNTDSLIELRRQIDATETVEEAQELAKLIVADHWILALVIPQVHLTIAGDRAAHIGEAATAKAEAVGARLDELDQGDPDVQAAQAALDAVEQAATEVWEVGERIPGVVLAITPDQMPDARSSLREAKGDLHESSTSLRRALLELRQALRQLADGPDEAA